MCGHQLAFYSLLHLEPLTILATSMIDKRGEGMRQKVTDQRGSRLLGLYNEVNRLRKRDGLEEIGLLTLAAKIQRFHPDRNPRMAEALSNVGIQIK
jgi:hypothetical protein